jgi:hypothetical protein
MDINIGEGRWPPHQDGKRGNLKLQIANYRLKRKREGISKSMIHNLKSESAI